jgi:hypothetical protein
MCLNGVYVGNFLTVVHACGNRAQRSDWSKRIKLKSIRKGSHCRKSLTLVAFENCSYTPTGST